MTNNQRLRRLAVCAEDRREAFLSVLRALSPDRELADAAAIYLRLLAAVSPGGPGGARDLAARAWVLRGLRVVPGGRISTERVREGALAIAQEGRPLLLVFVDALLELCGRWEEPRRERALFALRVLAPLAEFFGEIQLQRELEDLAFRCLDRPAYERVAALVALRCSERDALLGRLIDLVQGVVRRERVEAVASGRAKHLWSIHDKLERKASPAALHDLFGLRLITRDTASCYALLGALHSQFFPVHGRFKDYISRPKDSGYRSLHTTLWIDEPEALVEIQIRTAEMHEQAEHGSAAHWRYKRPGGLSEGGAWIFPVTPGGDVIRLPRGATVLDFAYAIHTELGRHFYGALVDGKSCRGDTPLGTGQIVRVLASARSSPTPGQIERARTHHARNRIRAALGGTKMR